MIKNLLVPENFGSYYIFTKRIVGIDITKTDIYATITKAHGYKRIIEQLIEEKIENDSSLTADERIIKALKSLKEKLGKYDSIYVAFSSSSVIFKELSLPFLGHKKIKMVVPFEVESLLPFTLDQAIIDSIIIGEDTENKRTNILVAAVKKEHISDFLNLFKTAGLTVDKITVDMFELYGLYKAIPGYASTKDTVALVDLGLYTTRIALLIDNQLKYIRVLPKGLVSISKKITQSTGLDANDTLQSLMHYGINKSDNTKHTAEFKSATQELFQELKFTIDAYINKLKAIDELKLVVLTGLGADIPGINDVITNTMKTDSKIFQAKKIIHNGLINSKVTTLPNNFLISIATSLATEITDDFNLNDQYVVEQKDKLIKNQLITMAIFSALLFGSFMIYSYLRIRGLKNQAKQAETEAITSLKSIFKLRDPKNLKDANKLASNELHKQESAWKQLSAENRYSFLNYLTELSQCINIKDSQLNLTSLNIKEDTIRLYGEVPDFTQLAKLQNQLKCPLFKNVPKLQEPNFKADPIILTINKDQES